MNSKLYIPVVLVLGLTSSLVFASNAASHHKQATATFKTQEGKEIRCSVDRRSYKELKKLKKGDKVEMMGVEQRLLESTLNRAIADITQ